MDISDQINNGDNPPNNDRAIEINRIKLLLENQVRRAECGSIVQISKYEILEPESCEQMRYNWLYGIISNKADYWDDTEYKAYQIN